ncbi:uncharacterized protein HaLaN_02625 [Haematococcus lacustris]|uniref:Tropinone reductase n=1 Tax=Haematococcus lacustris TaxID=44745 RepID=A0A699YCM7_HAELA|nr:uncharacterized protein HaLaN_02625 [Haematococcus lacustris]
MADITEASAAFALQRFGLTGKVALVTGGTKGIGAAIVEHFCKLGAKVFICARSEDDLEASISKWRSQGFEVQVTTVTPLTTNQGAAPVASICPIYCPDALRPATVPPAVGLVAAAQWPGSSRHFTLSMTSHQSACSPHLTMRPPASCFAATQGRVADVSQREQREALMAAVASEYQGRLDILVNNVGTNIRKPTVDYTSEEYSRLMATNLESAYHLCQVAHPLLKASGQAVVLFNSSVAGGPTAMRSGTIYAMTKAALNQLTKNLACEWAAEGIRVNCVAPWYTATELAMQVLQDEDFRRQVISRTPLARVGQPEEVAGEGTCPMSPAVRVGHHLCLLGLPGSRLHHGPDAGSGRRVQREGPVLRRPGGGSEAEGRGNSVLSSQPQDEPRIDELEGCVCGPQSTDYDGAAQ